MKTIDVCRRVTTILSCGCKMFAEADRKTKSTIEHCKEHKRQWNKHIKHKRSEEV